MDVPIKRFHLAKSSANHAWIHSTVCTGIPCRGYDLHKSLSVHAIMSKAPRARSRVRKPEPYVTGDGVWDKVKSAGKTALKYAAPVVAGLAGAAALHYATKPKQQQQQQKAVNPIDAFNAGNYDSSRYSDDALPYADTVTPSSHRNRNAEQVPLTPTSIQALLALKALHSAYEPSKVHPWTSGGGVNWIPGKRQWDWLTGGSLIGPTTLAALAEGHANTDPKIYHLMKCKHCQGSGIGQKLWNGIKGVGKEIYGGVKAVGKEALPYVVPVALAAGTAAAAYHGIPKIPGVTKGTYGIKHGIKAAQEFDYRKALSDATFGAPEQSTKEFRSGHAAGHRSKTYDHLDYFS